VMNYEAIWQVLAELVTELRKVGEVVPSQVMRDLRSAKTTIQIFKVDKDNPDHLLRIEELMGNVESYIMCTAQKRFGPETINKWTERLEKARGEVHEEIPFSRRFVPGIPRDKDWVGIKTTDDIPLKQIVQAAEGQGLLYKNYGNGYVIVYGEKGEIKDFIKRLMDLHKN